MNSFSSRGVFDLPTPQLPEDDVEIGRTIRDETIAGDIRKLKDKLCSLHCDRKKNPHKDPQFKC